VDKRVWWRYHKVASGETLASIARQYKTTPAAITEVNGLTAEEISPDTKLLIPIAEGKHAPGDVETLVFSRHPTRYRARRGDTVLSVADDFSVPPEKIRQWNHLKGNELRKGRSLVIYRPVRSAKATTLVSSKSHRSSHLQTSAKAVGNTEVKTEINGAGSRTHTVRQGETLYSIANDYGTTIDALKRDNKHASALLHPGDVLVIK
jgi:membrane-bound lytic murein transglycosylase D